MDPDFSLKYLNDGKRPRFLLTGSTGRLYTVSETLYRILLLKNDRLPDEEIAEAINKAGTSGTCTPESVRVAVEMTRARLRGGEARPEKRAYIFMKGVIIPGGGLRGLTRILTPMFKPDVMIVASVISAIATLSAFAVPRPPATLRTVMDDIVHKGFPGLLPLYACFLCIILLHETGHAAAASAFGIKPGPIGSGIYLIFPVFYTDVTGIWALPVRHRTIVNLAGVYLQLLINLPLAMLCHAGIYGSSCIALITVNTASIICSANPFLRGDGYWVFSDLFNIVNLKDRSGRPASLFNKEKGSTCRLSPLGIYRLLRLLFVLASFYAMYLSVQTLAESLSSGPHTARNAINQTVLLLLAGITLPLAVWVFHHIKNLKNRVHGTKRVPSKKGPDPFHLLRQ